MSLFKFRTNNRDERVIDSTNLSEIKYSIDETNTQFLNSKKLLAEYNDANNELRSEVEIQKLKLHNNEKELKRLNDEVCDEKADKAILQSRIDKIKSLNQEQEDQLKELSQKKQYLLTNISDLKKVHESQTKSHLSNIDELKNIQVELAKLESEESQLQATHNILNGTLVGKLDVNNQTAQLLNNAKKRIISLKRKIETENSEISKIENLIERNEVERVQVDSEIISLLEKTQDAVVKKDNLENQYESQKRSLEDAYQKRHDLELGLTAKLNAIMHLNTQQEELKNKLVKCNSSIKALVAETNELKQHENIQNSEISNLDSQVATKEKKIEELKSDLELLNLETQKLSLLVKENQEKELVASRKIEELKEKEGSSLVEIDRVNREWLNAKNDYEIVLTGSLESEERIKVLGKRLDTLTYNLEETTKKRDLAFKNNLIRTEQIAEMENKLLSDTQKLSDIKLELNELKGSEVEGRELLISLGVEIEQLKLRKGSALEQVSLLEKSIADVNAKVSKLNEHKHILNNEVAAQEELINLLSEDENKLLQTNNSLLVTIGSLKGKIQIGEARTEAKGKEVEILAQENHELSIESEQLSDKLNVTVQKIEKLDSQINEYERKSSNLNKLIKVNTQTIISNEELIVKLDRDLKKVKDHLTLVQDEFDASEKNKERVRMLLDKKKKKVHGVNILLEDGSKKLSDSKAQYTSLLETKKSIDDELILKERNLQLINVETSKLGEEVEKIDCDIVLTQDRVKHYHSSIVEHETLLAELEDKRNNLLNNFKLVQNEEIVANEELTKIENSCFSLRSKLASLESEIGNLEDKVKNSLCRKVQLTEEIESLETKTKIAQTDIIKLNGEVDIIIDELKAVESEYNERNAELKVELDEKDILTKEYNRRLAKLDTSKNQLADVSSKILDLTAEKESLKKNIEKFSNKKGQLLLTKDRKESEVRDLKVDNEQKRKLLEGMSLEIKQLKLECNNLEDEFVNEKEKSKILLDSLEMMRDQVREVKSKKNHQEQEFNRLFDNTRLAKRELNTTLTSFESEKGEVEKLQSKLNTSRNILSTLETTLSSVEFDANLKVDDQSLILLESLNNVEQINTYIKELPFVFKTIRDVELSSACDGSLRIATRGELRCEKELTKELLRSNVKGKFRSGVKFRLGNESIELFINPVNSTKTLSR